jgi:hypothetical protein
MPAIAAGACRGWCLQPRTGADRSQRFYAAWARAAASKGLVGILPDLRAGSETADFTLLVSYLAQHGAEHGIEGIAVYAGSGNVYNAFPAVEDPKQTAIKAAVMYYGAAPITQFRLDLPVLYVRGNPIARERVHRVADRAGRLAERAGHAPQSCRGASWVRDGGR